MLEIKPSESTQNTRKVNKEFHTTLATIAVTVLSILLAFYGITIVLLAQQAQTINQNAQTSKVNAISWKRQTDSAIRTFAFTIEPTISPNDWSISMRQNFNLQDMCNSYLKSNLSFSTLSDSAISSLLGNYSEAEKEDEAVREWLNSLNITRFKASYNLAEFSLHDIVGMLYTQFPTPPVSKNESQVIVFFDSSFGDNTFFLNWFRDYTAFHDDVSFVHSRINGSIVGISQAYSDAAKLTSEELDVLRKENTTDAWTIQTMGELITYDIAMSTYYPSVFEALDTIFSSGINAEAYVHQYNLYLTQYNAIRDLAAYPALVASVGLMAIGGIVIPMSLLVGSNWLEYKLDIRRQDVKKWQRLYNGVIVLSIVFFVSGAILGLHVLFTQISGLIPPL